jgi:hypothetical protein
MDSHLREVRVRRQAGIGPEDPDEVEDAQPCEPRQAFESNTLGVVLVEVLSHDNDLRSRRRA